MKRFSAYPYLWVTGPGLRTRRTIFVIGFLCGVLSLLGGRVLLNNTSLADHLVAPLLLEDTSGGADAIVVLGAGLVGPCVLNLNALRRVMLASRLWHDGRAPMVVFTGGSPNGLSCSVASTMAEFASALGVPHDRIRLETVSRSTRENAMLTAPLLRRESVKRVLLVTDRLHMPRSAGVFAQFGFGIERASVPVYEGHPDNVAMLAAGIREYVAMAYYKSRGWL